MRNSTKYWISINGEQKGPYVIANLMEMHLSSDTKVWKEDDNDWKIITEYPELAPYVVENKTDTSGKSRNVVWGVVFGTLAVVVIILFLNLFSLKKETSILRSTLKEKEHHVEEVLSDYKNKESDYEDKISELEGKLKDVSSVYPFKVTNIEIGNIRNDGSVINDYRSIKYSYSLNIFSSNVRYISPKIYFTGYIDKSVEINYKIYNPDGSLNYSSSYSNKYTGVPTTVVINKDEDNSATLKGWGNNNQSIYRSGRYRIEIWYNDVCFRSWYFDLK